MLNFFGSIDNQHVTHQVRGLNVVVRLRKSCPVMWPRLLLTAEKCNWVIQNFEAFKDEEIGGYNNDTDTPGK